MLQKREKREKKERHDDKTSTNGRFTKSPTVVILGHLTPLISTINIKTFMNTPVNAFRAPGFAWPVYKAEQHIVDKLGSTMKRLKDKLFNGCEAQLL